MDATSQVYSTFLASIRSVGTACTLATVGIYLHRISQQVTIPLLFFTKILHCNQDWSDEPCPNITDSLRDVWMLLFWPLHVVGVGALVGYAAARISGTPQHQRRAVWAACMFGNSTGLPITLLSVVHANFPSSSDLGRVDPCLFLSVYLLLYPVLQWGIGGWLLAPSKASSHANVVNQDMTDDYERSHRGMAEVDASLYMSVQDNLVSYQGVGLPTSNVPSSLPTSTLRSTSSTRMLKTDSAPSVGLDLDRDVDRDQENLVDPNPIETHNQIPSEIPTYSACEAGEQTRLLMTTSSSSSCSDSDSSPPISSTISKILSRCFQPPVVGALLGLAIASQASIRGVFVDLVDRDGSAPLEWIFDALYHVGQAAVPINMIILGCNLSASVGSFSSLSEKKKEYQRTELFSSATTLAIVIGKMVVQPVLGFLSAVVVRQYTDFPDGIDGSVYLVLLIVFLTPTANNVMVMVELGEDGKDGSTKQAMARVIAWQYALAPLILSGTMTAAVGIADQWS